VRYEHKVRMFLVVGKGLLML